MSLAYRDEDRYATCVIYDVYDIKDLEAARFLEAFEKQVVDMISDQNGASPKKGGSLANS